jgi:TPR repeat protein
MRNPWSALRSALLGIAALLALNIAPPAKGQGFDPAIEEKSCEIGSALSCQVMGSAYAQGNGVPKNMGRAAAYFQRACQGGNMQGCRGLGILHAVGEGVGQDFAQAEALFRQACGGGDTESCRLAELAKSDKELAASQQSAQQSPQRSTQPASAVAMPQGCVLLEPGAGSFWRAVNNCPRPVIGKFCYENDKYFNCGTQSPGGFGPIKPGGSEGISAPTAANARWRNSYCDYDAWNRGECSIANP